MKTLALGLTDRLERANLPIDPLLDIDYAEMGPPSGFADKLADIEALFTNPRVPIDDEFLSLAPKLKFIQLSSAGFERIDVEAVQRRGVRVANSSGENADTVAEWVFMGMIGLQRELLASHRALSEGRYNEFKEGQMARGLGELGGKTLGIIGLGQVGKRVARRAVAFNINVLYYDIVRPTPEMEKELNVTYACMDEILREADILTVHVPLTSETFHLVGEEELSMLKPTALVINAARGPLVDPAPLAAMIADGRIAGAAIDVFETEPAPTDDPLINLAASGCDRILVTPHMAGVTGEALLRTLQYSLANLVRVARGDKPQNICVDLKS